MKEIRALSGCYLPKSYVYQAEVPGCCIAPTSSRSTAGSVEPTWGNSRRDGHGTYPEGSLGRKLSIHDPVKGNTRDFWGGLCL